MRTINASELKAKLLAVLDEVATTGEPLTITKRGKSVAQLVPAVPRDAGYPQSGLEGSVKILVDVVEPAVPEDTWEANRPR